MTRDELTATLALHGWVPVHDRMNALEGWGISHPKLGSISEDLWHPKHGQTVAPLTVSPWVIHHHEPHRECQWGDIGQHTMNRIIAALKEQSWF